jgi:hypothetical protein
LVRIFNKKCQMNQIITLISLLLFFSIAQAKEIDENTARIVGKAFLASKTNSQNLKNTSNLKLALKANSKSPNTSDSLGLTTFFYVFNTNANGFVIVAGDDNITPILGYSDQGTFSPDNLPQNVAKWLEGYKIQIRSIINKNIQPNTAILKEWQNLRNGNNTNTVAGVLTSVNPLLQTQWNQSPFFNSLCPGGSVTGCVATATAQIMKYWNYPATGSGFHSYNHSTYGTLSANFGNTTYQWSSMPNIVNSNNNAVATLMYQVGVSVNMNYSPQTSGAYVIENSPTPQACSEYALKTYFGYSSTLHGVERVNYADIDWMNLLKSELNASRPVLYAGFGSGGGHCFVADGYDNNDFIHFNWGWGGYYDGFFQINALNPGGVGTGGGTGGFNSSHQAVVGIQPPVVSQSYNMSLYNYVTPSSGIINYGQAFTVSTNIANFGSNTFTGDYTAAIFDTAYNFIAYTQTLSGYTLQGGYSYTNNLVFTSTGLYGMVPGTYYVGIFYRPTGGNWVQVANNGSYLNLVKMTVVNPNTIELYSAMAVTPGLTLTQNQSASVKLNILNNGATTFFGQYQVGLYNLDGSLAQIIGTVSENNGLPPSYIYSSPYLTFSTPSLTVTPGTYLLAVQHNPSNTGWQLTGSTNYINPIRVTVIAATLQPDIYEINDTVTQSFTLPISFSGNNSTVNTLNSNCHTGTDNDYYKINLPAGYNYNITPRLHDLYNSGNGIIYSVDALFSFSPNAVNWSEAYDDTIPNSIVMSGGHTIYFHVAPFFAGEKGTYLLDIQIIKTTYQFIWTGITSNDWANGSNWSTGIAPTLLDSIVIPSNTPFSPVIKSGIIGLCKSIKVNSGAIVTVSSGGNLKIGM